MSKSLNWICSYGLKSMAKIKYNEEYYSIAKNNLKSMVIVSIFGIEKKRRRSPGHSLQIVIFDRNRNDPKDDRFKIQTYQNSK